MKPTFIGVLVIAAVVVVAIFVLKTLLAQSGDPRSKESVEL